MILNKKIGKSKWYKFEDMEFCIRLFKFSKFNIEDQKNALVEQYMYCLVDWKGVLDEDNTTLLKCDKENKMRLYDYYHNARGFIFEKINEEQENLDKAIKN